MRLFIHLLVSSFISHYIILLRFHFVEHMFPSLILAMSSSSMSSQNPNPNWTNGTDGVTAKETNANSSHELNSSKSFKIWHSGSSFQRQNLLLFLKTSAQGRMILFYYEKHQCLSDNLQNHLTQLLIDRELLFILVKKNESITNPLKKLSSAKNRFYQKLENRIQSKQNFFKIF